MSDKPTSQTFEAQKKKGAFARRPTSFHGWITADGPFTPDSGRYHIYASHACPWAHRVLVVRALKGLEAHISADIVDHFMGEEGWSMLGEDAGETGDTVNGKRILRQIYTLGHPDYQVWVIVFVMWDRNGGVIVNNESSEIIRMFNDQFQHLAERPHVDLFPAELHERIEQINSWVYPLLNNGVYKAGFTRSQEAHDEAERGVFEALDRLEAILASSRWVAGDRFTEADVRVFTTLVRFDTVYNVHFKCSLKRLVDYPHTWAHTREIATHPLIESTFDMRHAKLHYYRSHESINPRRIVPIGPILNWDEPHNRQALGGEDIP